MSLLRNNGCYHQSYFNSSNFFYIWSKSFFLWNVFHILNIKRKIWLNQIKENRSRYIWYGWILFCYIDNNANAIVFIQPFIRYEYLNENNNKKKLNRWKYFHFFFNQFIYTDLQSFLNHFKTCVFFGCCWSE